MRVIFRWEQYDLSEIQAETAYKTGRMCGCKDCLCCAVYAQIEQEKEKKSKFN